MQIQALQIDNFFENPTLVREYALAQEYIGPNEDENWLGLRTKQMDSKVGNIDINKSILSAIKYHLPELPELEIFWVFHILPAIIKDNTDTPFDYQQLHIDSEKVDFAGVIYLTPNPPEHSGTSFYETFNKKLGEVKNVYNKFVVYPADILHAPTNPFGETNEDSRLALTFFCSIKQ